MFRRRGAPRKPAGRRRANAAKNPGSHARSRKGAPTAHCASSSRPIFRGTAIPLMRHPAGTAALAPGALGQAGASLLGRPMPGRPTSEVTLRDQIRRAVNSESRRAYKSSRAAGPLNCIYYGSRIEVRIIWWAMAHDTGRCRRLAMAPLMFQHAALPMAGFPTRSRKCCIWRRAISAISQ